MPRLLLLISLLSAAFSEAQANSDLKKQLDSVQYALESGPDSNFHKLDGKSDTFAAALKNPFLGDAENNDTKWLRLLIFFAVLTVAIFLRIWKNSMDRKQRESQP